MLCTLGTFSLLIACQPTPSDAVPEAAQPPVENPPESNSDAEAPITARIASAHPPGSLDPARVSLTD